MEQRIYRIRRAFLIPLGVDTLLLCCLFVLALIRGSGTERLVFGLFFFPALYLFAECLLRRVTLGEKGVLVRKLWREKGFSWEEITNIGGVTVHKKVYLLISTLKGLFILSNAYGDFSSLTGQILSRVDPARVEEDVRAQAGRYPPGIAQVAMAWVAALFMVGIVSMKLWLS
jgi:hypothetical protein